MNTGGTDRGRQLFDGRDSWAVRDKWRQNRLRSVIMATIGLVPLFILVLSTIGLIPSFLTLNSDWSPSDILFFIMVLLSTALSILFLLSSSTFDYVLVYEHGIFTCRGPPTKHEFIPFHSITRAYTEVIGQKGYKANTIALKLRGGGKRDYRMLSHNDFPGRDSFQELVGDKIVVDSNEVDVDPLWKILQSKANGEGK